MFGLNELLTDNEVYVFLKQCEGKQRIKLLKISCFTKQKHAWSIV